MGINKINRPFDVMGTMQEPISKHPLVEEIEASQTINKDENPEGRGKKRGEDYKKLQEERKKMLDDGKGKIIDKMV